MHFVPLFNTQIDIIFGKKQNVTGHIFLFLIYYAFYNAMSMSWGIFIHFPNNLYHNPKKSSQPLMEIQKKNNFSPLYSVKMGMPQEKTYMSWDTI
jgi:hypothetical protein